MEPRVERVSKVAPQLEQLTAVAASSGWIPFFIASFLRGERELAVVVVAFVGLESAERGREVGQGLSLELPDALAGQLHLTPDRLERLGLTVDPEPQLEDPPLPLRKLA